MSLSIGIVIGMLITLFAVITIQHLRIRILVEALTTLGKRVGKLEVELFEVKESSELFLKEHEALKAEVSCRDAYAASDDDYQKTIDFARDRLSLEKLRQKFGISSSLYTADHTAAAKEDSISMPIGSES